jgi:hypothetical protein
MERGVEFRKTDARASLTCGNDNSWNIPGDRSANIAGDQMGDTELSVPVGPRALPEHRSERGTSRTDRADHVGPQHAGEVLVAPQMRAGWQADGRRGSGSTPASRP